MIEMTKCQMKWKLKMRLDLGDELDIEDETEDFASEELPPLDLTSASDEEVLKVFKAMGEDDGIVVYKRRG